MAHTVNLAAKGILRPFDTKIKAKEDSNENSGDSDDEDHALLNLVNGLNIEQLQAEIQDLEKNGESEKDREDGFVDVFEEMNVAEKTLWVKAVIPLRSALVKVSGVLS